MAIIDPAMQAYIESLLGSGAGGGASVGALPTDYADQGDWLTDAKKYGGLNADMSFQIGQNNLQPGAYSQVPTYNPLKNASGYNQLAQWSNGTPFQRWVARQIQGDPVTGEVADAMTIQSRLAALVSGNIPEGVDPTVAAEVVASLPPMLDLNNQSSTYGQPLGQPDIQKAFDTIEGLTTSISQSDPWDYQTFDPATGTPATMGSEDSPALQKLRELGYTTTPGETFDPYSFAPQGVTAEGDAQRTSQAQEAMQAYLLSQDQYNSAAGSSRGMRQAYAPDGLGTAIQDRIAAGTAGGPPDSSTDNRSQAARFFQGAGETALNAAAAPMNVGGAVVNGVANLFRGPGNQRASTQIDLPAALGDVAGSIYGAMDTGESLTASERAARQRTGGRSAQDVIRGATQRGVDQSLSRNRANVADATQTRLKDESRKALETRSRNKKSAQEQRMADLSAQRDNAIRLAYVQHLAQNGLTPFDLENRQRMGY